MHIPVFQHDSPPPPQYNHVRFAWEDHPSNLEQQHCFDTDSPWEQSNKLWEAWRDSVSLAGNLSRRGARTHCVFYINNNKCFFHGTSPVLSDSRDLSEAPGHGPAVCLPSSPCVTSLVPANQSVSGVFATFDSTCLIYHIFKAVLQPQTKQIRQTSKSFRIMSHIFFIALFWCITFVLQSAKGLQGNKDSRILWVKDDFLITTGFDMVRSVKVCHLSLWSHATSPSVFFPLHTQASQPQTTNYHNLLRTAHLALCLHPAVACAQFWFPGQTSQ